MGLAHEKSHAKRSWRRTSSLPPLFKPALALLKLLCEPMQVTNPPENYSFLLVEQSSAEWVEQAEEGKSNKHPSTINNWGRWERGQANGAPPFSLQLDGLILWSFGLRNSRTLEEGDKVNTSHTVEQLKCKLPGWKRTIWLTLLFQKGKAPTK